MTIAQTFRTHPVVLRFKGMFPHQIAAYERHRKREGADEEHIDKSRTFANRLLIGSEDWASSGSIAKRTSCAAWPRGRKTHGGRRGTARCAR